MKLSTRNVQNREDAKDGTSTRIVTACNKISTNNT
jgi:hypothetical protein